MLVEVTRTGKKVVKIKYEDGVLKVVANRFVSRSKIKQIIAENIDWINAQRDKHSVDSNKSVSSPRIISDNSHLDGDVVSDIWAGRKTLILGDVIDVLPHYSAKTVLEGNTLFICDKSYQNREQRRKLVVSYLKRVAQVYVSVEVSEFGTQMSICPAKIEFKEVSQGWVKQALLDAKILCIDYRVAQLPQDLRSYVIADSFARLICNSDSAVYAQNLQRFAPNCKRISEKLRQYDFLKEI